MTGYEDFCEAHETIQRLEKFVSEASVGGSAYPELKEMAEGRIAALKALFDEPAPPPVEPVKPKAKRGDVDGAVRNALGSEITDYPARDWTAWAKEMGLNRKSVLAAVRRHTEKNRT